MVTDRLTTQLGFVLEVEKLKQVFRQTLLLGDHRRENDAEHSWHLCLMAILLVEHAAADVDLLKVLKMLLIHDVVEIDAGDTFAYDVVGNEDKAQREQQAADRLFGLVPQDQAPVYRACGTSSSSDRARRRAMRRRLTDCNHYCSTFTPTGRGNMRFKKAQVIARNEHMGEGAPALWEFARELIDAAVAKGILAE